MKKLIILIVVLFAGLGVAGYLGYFKFIGGGKQEAVQFFRR